MDYETVPLKQTTQIIKGAACESGTLTLYNNLY